MHCLLSSKNEFDYKQYNFLKLESSTDGECLKKLRRIFKNIVYWLFRSISVISKNKYSYIMNGAAQKCLKILNPRFWKKIVKIAK